MDPAADKSDLRRRMRAARAALSQQTRAEGAASIARMAELIGTPGAVVSGFLAIGDEIDPARLLDHLIGLGRRVCLPVMVGKGKSLQFRAYASGDELATVQWGIREPKAHQSLLDPDVVLVPLLAVDRRGQRLGYGGGYYDRTLRALRARKPLQAIGVAFDMQILDAVPFVDYDEPLDALLTPSGLAQLSGPHRPQP